MNHGSLSVRHYSCRLFSLGVLGVFLLLGFCPLRNMLCRLAQPEPVTKAQPAPDYAKITSGKECVTFTMVTQRAAQPALSPNTVFRFAGSCAALKVTAGPIALTSCSSTIPLYLRNRALRI